MVQSAYGSCKVATTRSGAEMRLMFGQSVNADGWIVRMADAPGGGVKAIKVERAVHPLKELSSMVVTDSEMVMLANELHSWKARHPMVVTESPMAILANEVHSEKAHSPMVVTESGMVMLTNELHL